jgi:hypothetical protein
MKKILGLVCVFASVSSFAGSVKITSFAYATSTSKIPLAELCGLVEDASSPAFVEVKVDTPSAKAATYNTIAGTDGKFCVAVITYRGTAEVGLFGGETVSASIH